LGINEFAELRSIALRAISEIPVLQFGKCNGKRKTINYIFEAVAKKNKIV
jgi:hypothetical protein